MGAAASNIDCSCKNGSKRALEEREEEEEDSVVAANPEFVRDVSPKFLEKELLNAAKSDDAEQVKALLQQRVDIDCPDKRNKTPLHYAVMNGKLATATVLLEMGANKEAIDGQRKTPLLVAASKGEEDLAKLLLDCAANMEAKGEDGRTALHLAALNGQFATSKLLVNYKADIDAKRKNGSSALSYAAVSGNLDLVKLFMRKGAKMASKDKKALGRKLFEAVSEDDLEYTKRLLMYSASTEVRDEHNLSPLLVAVTHGRSEIGKLIADKGVSKQEMRELGIRLLDACGQGEVNTVDFLLACSASIEEQDCFNETPLWKASIKGQTDVVRFLLDKKAKIEVESRNCCRTPVVIAIDRGHSDTVHLLLDKRAKLPELRHLGRKLRDAAKLGEASRARCLLECRADVNAADLNNETPLHLAAEHDKTEVARILLDHGADLEARTGKSGTKTGRTPMDCAASAQATTTLNLLMEAGVGKAK